MKRRSRSRFAFVGAALLVGSVAACILADPLSEQRSLPTRRPSILHGSVSPLSSQILTATTLSSFTVPIRLYNPTVQATWNVFVDYNPPINSSPALSHAMGGTPNSADLQIVDFRLAPKDLDPTRCHVIEFLVALSFLTPHSADPYGADSLTWFYIPNGDRSTCAVYDGGTGTIPPPSDAGGPDGGGADGGNVDGGADGGAPSDGGKDAMAP